MIDGTLRIEGQEAFPFCGWGIVITDDFGNDWWAAMFPTHTEATRYGRENLRGHCWRVLLVAGPLRHVGPTLQEELRKNPAAAIMAGRELWKLHVSSGKADESR